jgi:peptidoglycan/xylan/chitin deacetylase (PgdA/CDA1 family)
MPCNRLSSFSSMSRRAIFLAVALLLLSGAAAAFFSRARAASAQQLVPRPRPVLRLPATLPQRTITLPILMYHLIGRIRTEDPPITQRLTVTPADFDAQMRWLKRDGFHAVSQAQAYAALERGAKLPSHPIMITFDDGYRDVWANALPVLVRLHMPATAYVITSRISDWDPRTLTWGQLHALERGGVTIGSHTVTHPDLTTLADADALAELRNSRRKLERHLKRPVQWFAYPAGAHDARIVELVRRAGYVLAVTTQPGPAQSAQTPLELHRYEILDSTHVSGLAALLASARG